MYESFGAFVQGQSVQFRLFFPDAGVDATQYQRGGLPRIQSIKVVGSFQAALGGTAWDIATAPPMTRQAHAKGMLYTCDLPPLTDGFYEYKYFVTFLNSTTRWCPDPCGKYGGATDENSAFVVGGNATVVQPIAKRLPLKDLIIYELMIDDFTAEWRGTVAPLEAILSKVQHLVALGINAVEFMPWTAWPDNQFSWGYDPAFFFSVEHRYTLNPATPLDKLYKLQILINALHAAGLHVIMDGVFNHAKTGDAPGSGFPYYWLYENPTNSPYIGNFAWTGYFEDLDYANQCTEEFVHDICHYWVDTFQIDGIRFDYVLGFLQKSHPPVGIERLIADLDADFTAAGRLNMSLTLELMTDNRFEAIGKTNALQATGCWFDPMLWAAFDVVRTGNLGTDLVRRLNAGLDFDSDKAPITYIENHDHRTLTEEAGGRAGKWWRTQPMAVALMTCCGAPMIHNGQEFGEQYWFPEGGNQRVQPRPLRWTQAADGIGQNLLGLYALLCDLRKKHPALRSTNFYPWPYSESDTRFNSQGYGVDLERDVAIYHRWGNDDGGKLERFIVVLNASDFAQSVDIPFPEAGQWEDLLNGGTATASGYWLRNQTLASNWARIYFQRSP